MESQESHGDMLDRKTGTIATCQIQSAIESVFSWTLVTQMYFGKYTCSSVKNMAWLTRLLTNKKTEPIA